MSSVLEAYQLSKISLIRSIDGKDWNFTITLSSAHKDILLQKINTKIEFKWIPAANGTLITEFGWGEFRMVSLFKPNDILQSKLVLVAMCAKIVERVSGVGMIEITPGTFRIISKQKS